ncbi:MAG: Gfo/Idh/MocA family oxidoreductase [Clostridia bacterium]|nr:Gfo/Idh/MocA family oxidoreductase [Clostridia bacterium]
MLKIGVIGYGIRISSIVKELVETGEVQLVAVADIDVLGVKKRFQDFEPLKDATFYSDAEEMLKKERLDGVCIGTRCSLHTHYALLVARYNIPMFLEKPVCTNYEDLERLKSILHVSEKTVVSFPLRFTVFTTRIKEMIEGGKCGEIVQVQAYNNVSYGHRYYHKWYRDEKETGGMFMQKATHDFDYINYVLGEIKPVRVCAMKSKQYFKGDKPEGLLCSSCPDAKTCPESPQNIMKHDPAFPGEQCCFAVDTGNEDSGSAIVEYDNGMHVTYTQNFVTKFDAAKRGARFIGTEATLEFDWTKSEMTVYNHRDRFVERHTCPNNAAGHFGADPILIQNFVDVMKGEDASHATLCEGILSAEMCLAARKSAEEHIFVDITRV